MTLLRELPPGMMYVCDKGKTLLDHHGNLYAAPAAPLPTPAQTPTPKPEPTPPKPITLSESARQEIAAMMPELGAKASEHTLWCVTDGAGVLLDAFSTSSGHDDKDASDHRASIERVVKTPGRKGLFLVHNHPRFAEGGGGDAKPSADDHKFTAWVKETLAPFSDIQLLDHHIIGANLGESRSIYAADTTPDEPLGRTPAWERTITEAVRRLEARMGITSQASEEPRFSESEEIPTLDDIAQLKESRLWAPYGGVNPYRYRR